MPEVSQAPAVIPILEISDEEKQERIDDLDKALKLQRGIREKVAKVLPQVEDILQDFAKLQDHCAKTQPLRIVRLGRVLMAQPLFRLALGARFHLQRLNKVSEIAERSAGDIEKDLLDPEIVPPNRPVKRKANKSK
jgi:hypothetical protein